MHKMIFLNLTLTAAFLFLLVNVNEVYSQNEQQQSSNSPMELTAKLVGNEYRWIGSNNSTNPTLNITSVGDNEITVKSIQGDSEEHEIILEGITSDGDKEELVASDEIKGGSSDTIKFNPEDVQDEDYKSFEYYCEYHPDTMRGKVQIK